MNQSIKQRMLEGNCVFGTWCMLPSSAAVDVIARTGLDFIVIDLEHGAISWETAEDMVKTCQLHGCQPIIRTGNDQENTILHALETDCRCILVPHVSSKLCAQSIAKQSRYQPFGIRGLSPYTRCHGYDHTNLESSIQVQSKETLVGVLIEGSEGIKNLPEIACVEGIDLIYLGLYDISQSIGLSGQLEHPKVLEELQTCLSVIQSNNKLAGTFVRDIETGKEFREIGFSFIAYVADSFALMNFYSKANAKFKS